MLVKEQEVRNFFRRADCTLLRRFGFHVTRAKISGVKNRFWVIRTSFESEKLLPAVRLQFKKDGMTYSKLRSYTLQELCGKSRCYFNYNFRKPFFNLRQAIRKQKTGKQVEPCSPKRLKLDDAPSLWDSDSDFDDDDDHADDDYEGEVFESDSDIDSDSAAEKTLDAPTLATLATPTATKAATPHKTATKRKRRYSDRTKSSQEKMLRDVKRIVREYTGECEFSILSQIIADAPAKIAAAIKDLGRDESSLFFETCAEMKLLQVASKGKEIGPEDVLRGMFNASTSLRSALDFIDGMVVNLDVEPPTRYKVNTLLKRFRKKATPVVALEDCKEFHTHQSDVEDMLRRQFESKESSEHFDPEMYKVKEYYTHKALTASLEKDRLFFANQLILIERKRAEGKYSKGGILLKSTSDGLNLKRAIAKEVEVTLTQNMNSCKLRTNPKAAFVSVLSIGKETDSLVRRTLKQYYDDLHDLMVKVVFCFTFSFLFSFPDFDFIQGIDVQNE